MWYGDGRGLDGRQEKGLRVEAGEQGYRLRLLDPLGRVVRQLELKDRSADVDVRELPVGIYHLLVDAGEQSAPLRARVVVQR